MAFVTAVNIRKFVLKAARLQDLVELGSLTQQAARFLDASVRAGLNILVAGGTQAGKTTLDRTGEGAAVGRQREACLRLCSERGWEVAQEFSDNDVSASAKKPRPAYVRMLAAVERGEAEVIVAWQVDRLTRKLTELEELIQIGERTGVRIATVGGDVDLSTDAGRLVGRILASVAKGEMERKGTRQKLAQQQAAQEGRPAGGRRPFGRTVGGSVRRGRLRGSP